MTLNDFLQGYQRHNCGHPQPTDHQPTPWPQGSRRQTPRHAQLLTAGEGGCILPSTVAIYTHSVLKGLRGIGLTSIGPNFAKDFN